MNENEGVDYVKSTIKYALRMVYPRIAKIAKTKNILQFLGTWYEASYYPRLPTQTAFDNFVIQLEEDQNNEDMIRYNFFYT